MITFTDAWRRAAIHPDGTMTILAHKTSSIGWTVALPAPTRIVHVAAGTLEFQPAGAHQVAALANLGHQLLQEIDAYRPGFLWTASPAEIVGALIEEMAPPATAAAQVRAVAERASTGPTDCDMIDFLELTGSVQWDLENCTIRFDVPDDLMSGSVREILKAAIVAFGEKA